MQTEIRKKKTSHSLIYYLSPITIDAKFHIA